MAARSGKGVHYEIARRWGVSARTIFDWQSQGLPVGNEHQLAKALLDNPRTTSRIKSKALSVQRGFGGEMEAEEEAIANAEVRIRATIEDIIAECERIIAQYKSDEAKARERRDAHAVEQAMKRYVATAKDLIDIKGKLHRMGTDTSNSVTRTECTRIFGALGAAMAKGVHALLKKAPDEILALKLEAPAVLLLMVQPLREALNYAAASGLPGWATEAIIKAAGDVLENGEEELQA